MTMHTSEPVAVWLDQAHAPTRLVYRNVEFRIIDSPTRLPRHAWLASSAESASQRMDQAEPGWRVTGCADTQETRVFDLRLLPRGWIVENVFA
ncbi:hypothetical protein GE115_02680 [Agromyces sp. CFH 90414]|uniref:Uncharacterized protein n=1 Tax=Agromyces agglutinans TaxID=2662258 RepID=A0A6I2F2N8_9MICO|nr:hypothetical protein [Agromyces agglutinans]MRG58782.1 hypothetical protein [Agromyces agglutinans]